jgi:hypothetical protein
MFSLAGKSLVFSSLNPVHHIKGVRKEILIFGAKTC